MFLSSCFCYSLFLQFSFFRLGGPDPLDYISMYRNVGCPGQDIPEHWHYVSLGLSDLYGDNRVHE